MSKTKKIAIALAAVVGALVLVVAVAALTLDPQAIIASKKDALLKDISAQIGRELVSGDVSARVGMNLGATITGVRLAGPLVVDGKPGAAQLEIQQIDVQLSLVRALMSFGTDLRVERFVVDGLVVRAARDIDGVWNFQDMLDKLAAETDPGKAAAKTDTSALQGLRIAGVLVRNARVEIDDAVLGRPLAVGDLNATVSDIVLGTPVAVSVQAQLEDGGRKSAVNIDVKLALLPENLSFDPLPDLDIKAMLAGVDLGPWGGLAPADAPAPVAGVLKADITTKLSANTDVVDIQGTVSVRGLMLRDSVGALASRAERLAAARGTPLDLDIALGLHIDPTETRLEKLSINGSGIKVDGTLSIMGSGIVGLQGAAVVATVDDVQKILSALPPSLRGLPPELAITGPLEARVTKRGEAVTAHLGLDAAHLRYSSKDEKTGVPSALFDKAAGKALNLKLAGKIDGKTLSIDDFAIVVDTFKLGGKLVIPSGDGALSADVHSGSISLAALQGLVPPFQEAIGRGQKVEGVVSIDVKATSVAAQQEATIELSLKGLDVNLASTIVQGSGGVDIKATPAGAGVAIVAKADLDGLSIRTVTGAETTFNKPAGLPLRLDVDVNKGEHNAVINNAKLVIGKTAISGSGRVDNIGTNTESMNLDFGVVDVAFDDLRQALPFAGSLPVGGHLKGALALKGGLSATALALNAKNLDVSFGASRLAGQLSVTNFDAPVVDINLSMAALAFDDLRPLSDSLKDLPAGGRFDGSVMAKGDTAQKSTLSLDVKIARLMAGKSDLKGDIKVTDLDKPRFVMSTSSDFLDVDGLRAAFGSSEPATPQKSTPDDNPHGLSKSTRALLAGVSGKATLTAKRALVKGMPMSNFTGALVMTRGVAKFDKLSFGFYGGTVTADGTNLDLPAQSTKYDLSVDSKDIDFGAFLADQSPMGKVFKGIVSAGIHVKGRGLATGDFAVTAEGPASLSFKQLSIASLDVLGPLNAALQKSGKAGGVKAASASEEQGLTLRNFTALTTLLGGKMKLQKPFDADTPLGKLKTEGSSSLDGVLDFTSTLMLSPATVAKMTGNKVKLTEAVPVPMKLGGTWASPRITGLEIDKLLLAIVGDQAKGLVEKGTAALGDKAKEQVGAVLGDEAAAALGALFGDKEKDKDKKKKNKKK